MGEVPVGDAVTDPVANAGAELAAVDLAGGLGEEYRTRPGTPMIGPYSVNQMDDFYAALAVGQVKPTGVMNYVQRLYVADRCPAGARVVDVCCGRGLQLPVVYRYRPTLGGYLGLDISADNLAEAHHRIADLDQRYGHTFPVDLVQCDVAAPWPITGAFDVAIYTSALEHLPREQGIASLRHTAAALAPDGRLYLSTPNTTGPPPRKLQHRVHVYEWSDTELRDVLADIGLTVDTVVGLLPPAPTDLAGALASTYGSGAAAWYEQLREVVPAAFLDTVSAATMPDAAVELLYVCSTGRPC
jgi:SAM-dependent methyltransferase